MATRPSFLEFLTTIVTEKGIMKCVKTSLCILSFIQFAPKLISCFWAIFADNSIHLLIITADFVSLYRFYWICPFHYHFISCRCWVCRQCLLNSKVLSCFSGVIISIRSFFLFQNDVSSSNIPGDFGGNAHRGTRWHSMQSFGGPFHSKITWARIGLTEGCNRRKCALDICSLKLSAHWLGFWCM